MEKGAGQTFGQLFFSQFSMASACPLVEGLRRPSLRSGRLNPPTKGWFPQPKYFSPFELPPFSFCSRPDSSFHNPPLPVQYRRRAGEAGRHVGGIKPKLRSRPGERPRPASGFGRRARTLATHYFGNSRREKVCGMWFSARRRKPRAGGGCSPATAAGARAGAARRRRPRERGRENPRPA